MNITSGMLEQPNYIDFVDEDIAKMFKDKGGYFLHEPLLCQLIKELRLLNKTDKKQCSITKIAVKILNEYESKTLQEILVTQGKTWPTGETRYINIENVWGMPICFLVEDTTFSVTHLDNSMVADYKLCSLEQFFKLNKGGG